MKQVAIIKFEDADVHDEALAIVRGDTQHVVVGLSLKSNGDMQVVMPHAAARKLVDALRQALSSTNDT